MMMKVALVVLVVVVVFVVIRLTDWDDERGESVTTDHTAIVHDVLRSDLPVSNEITASLGDEGLLLEVV